MQRSHSSPGISRRTVIKATVAGALFAASGFGLARTPGARADTPVEKIFRGGTVVTVEEGQPLAEAVAVGGGRILAVGPEAEIMALAAPGPRSSI
jgi:hypothetical protein